MSEYETGINVSMERTLSTVIKSEHRVAAAMQNERYIGSENPSPLPVLNFETDTPNEFREVIRGFDVCLVHVPGNVYQGCMEPVKRRGLCKAHVGYAQSLVSDKQTTWERLEALHVALPSSRSNSSRKAGLSFKDFIALSAEHIKLAGASLPQEDETDN